MPRIVSANFVWYSRHQSEFSGLGIEFLTLQPYSTIFIAPLLSCNISGFHINCVRKPHSINFDMQLYSGGFSRIIAIFLSGICIADAFLFLPRSIFASFDQAGWRRLRSAWTICCSGNAQLPGSGSHGESLSMCNNSKSFGEIRKKQKRKHVCGHMTYTIYFVHCCICWKSVLL